MVGSRWCVGVCMSGFVWWSEGGAVVMCGVGAGVGVQCVVCGVCGACAWCVLCVCGVVCVVCVWRGKHPNVGSKRLRVQVQNARMLNTCARFAGAHGGFSNLHTEATLSHPSFSSWLSFSSLFFSLSNNDNDHSSSGLSLYTHGYDLPECRSA